MRGQALVFFALVLPMVLLPVTAFAVDSAVLSTHAARLREACAVSAEEAVQQIDGSAYRAGSGMSVDANQARSTALASMSAQDPSASATVTTTASSVEVTATEQVQVPFDFLGAGVITLSAHADARLTPGYDSPSSLLPLPTSTF